MSKTAQKKWKFIPTEIMPAPYGVKKNIIKLLRDYDSIEVNERDLWDALDVKHDRQELLEAKKAFRNLWRNGRYNFISEFCEDKVTFTSNTCCQIFYIERHYRVITPNKRRIVYYKITRNDDFAFAEGLV